MDTRPHSVEKDLLVVYADDTINDDVAELVIKQVEADLIGGRFAKVIVDCTRVGFLSSYGLSMFLRLHSTANNAKGQLRLSNVNSLVLDLLRMSKVNQLFGICPDVEQARLTFGAAAS